MMFSPEHYYMPRTVVSALHTLSHLFPHEEDATIIF